MIYRILATVLLVAALLVAAFLQDRQETQEHQSGSEKVPSMTSDEAALKSLKIN